VIICLLGSDSCSSRRILLQSSEGFRVPKTSICTVTHTMASRPTSIFQSPLRHVYRLFVRNGDYTGGNFRILPASPRCAAPWPEEQPRQPSGVLYVPNQRPTFRIVPKLRSICLRPAPTVPSLIHRWKYSTNYVTVVEERLVLFWSLRNGT
jgi:hypothetical protein